MNHQNTFMEKLLDGVAVEWKPLGEVATYSKARIGFEKLNVENHVSVENLLQNKAGKTNSTCVPTQGKHIQFQDGDILIGNIRPYLKKIWLADRTGGTNGDVLAIHISNKAINPRFLYQLLGDDKFFIYNMQHAKGAKMPRGNKDKILEFPIPIPCPESPRKSLEIQAEIVRILDTFTELTARKKQFTYYRDQLLSFEEGEVEWKSLGEVYKFQYGKGNTIPTSGGDYPVYGSNGIVGSHSEYNSENSPVIGHIGAYAGIVN